ATPYTQSGGGGTAGTPLIINFSVVDQATPIFYNLNVSATNGTVTKSPNQTSYASGTNVQLTATPATGYRFSGWSGDASGTTNPITVSMTGDKNITANFIQVAGQQVVSFTLMNASTDQPIRNLISGDVIDVNTIKNLNIRANTNPTIVGSVAFNLSGPQTRSSTETGAPYALFGDSGGNYNVWVPTPGSYTLTATPYSGAGGGGTAGTPLVITFSVVNSAPTHSISEQVTAYPNPTLNGFIQVNQTTIWEGTITYILSSATGATLATGEFNLTEPTNTLKFNFSTQMSASGIYHLQLISDKQKSSLVLIRQ
ncbi:MAG: T9SS type A sorting domain-containing protein, partial [Bacteroidota bacterium]|nr:T9SS type A sorting domain-containing protein [Bacteroidota bacterium]